MNIHSNILYFLSSPSICVQIFEIGAIFTMLMLSCALACPHTSIRYTPREQTGTDGCTCVLGKGVACTSTASLQRGTDKSITSTSHTDQQAADRRWETAKEDTRIRDSTRGNDEWTAVDWSGEGPETVIRRGKKKHDRHTDTDFGKRKEENSVSGAHPEDDGAGHIVFEEPGQGSSRQGSGGDSGEGAVGAGPGAKR